MTTKTEITIPLPADSSLGDLITDRTALEAMLDNVEKAALSMAPDTSTAKGRDEIKSNAYKIAQSKTALDKAGLASTESLRAKVSQVNELRAVAKERLGALQEAVRKPLTEWEEKKKREEEELKANLAALETSLDATATSDQISAELARVTEISTGEEWSNHQSQAEGIKDQTLAQLAALMRAAQQREADQRELEALRAEREERQRADEAAQQALREAEAAERSQKEAAERAERHAAEVAAAAKAAEERAAQEAKEREARHAQELEEAAAAERARIEQQRADAAAEDQRQLENTRRRNRIIKEIAESLDALGTASTKEIAEAIISGRIKNVAVKV